MVIFHSYVNVYQRANKLTLRLRLHHLDSVGAKTTCPNFCPANQSIFVVLSDSKCHEEVQWFQ